MNCALGAHGSGSKTPHKQLAKTGAPFIETCLKTERNQPPQSCVSSFPVSQVSHVPTHAWQLLAQVNVKSQCWMKCGMETGLRITRAVPRPGI